MNKKSDIFKVLVIKVKCMKYVIFRLINFKFLNLYICSKMFGLGFKI